jgi:hypothetical protein
MGAISKINALIVKNPSFEASASLAGYDFSKLSDVDQAIALDNMTESDQTGYVNILEKLGVDVPGSKSGRFDFWGLFGGDNEQSLLEVATAADPNFTGPMPAAVTDEGGSGFFSSLLPILWGVGGSILAPGVGTAAGAGAGSIFGPILDNLLGGGNSEGKPWTGKPSQNLYGFLYGNYGGGKIYNPADHPDWKPIIQTLMNSYRINGFNAGQGNAEYEAGQIINGLKPLSALDTEFKDAATAQAYYAGRDPRGITGLLTAAPGQPNYLKIGLIVLAVGIAAYLAYKYLIKKK